MVLCAQCTTCFWFDLLGDVSTHQSTATSLIAVVGATICLVALLKWYCSGGVCKSKAWLDGKH